MSSATTNVINNLHQTQLEELIEAMPKSDTEEEFPMRFYSVPTVDLDSDDSMPPPLIMYTESTTATSDFSTGSDHYSDGAPCQLYSRVVTTGNSSDSDAPPELVPVSASSSDTETDTSSYHESENMQHDMPE